MTTRAFLERLAQHFEHVAAELEHLVEKQHAVMGEADFAGPRLRAAADERGVGDGVVRRAERAIGRAARRRGGSSPATECTAVTSSASSKVSGGRIPGDAPRHHRLARAGRADEQQVVAAGRRDLEGATRQELTADVGEIGRGEVRSGQADGGVDVGTSRRRIVQALHGLGERRHRQNVEARRRSRPRRRSARAAECRPGRRAAPPRRSAARRAWGESIRRATARRAAPGRRSAAARRRLAPPECRARSADRTTRRPFARRPARGSP